MLWSSDILMTCQGFCWDPYGQSLMCAGDGLAHQL